MLVVRKPNWRNPLGASFLSLAMLSALLHGAVNGHGQMNYPPSTRQGLPGKTWPGALSGEGAGGYCEQPNSMNPQNPLNCACMLFSQPSAAHPNISTIPGPPTNNASQFRTNNINVSSGPADWTARMPWRAPGSAAVLGSGCGVAGGGDVFNSNGGWPPTGMDQGADVLDVLSGPPGGRPVTTWARGATVRVAWGMWANHGGGYSWRLCRNEPGVRVTEACFQQTPLNFSGTMSWLQHLNGSVYAIPRVTVTRGTHPAGSQWARNPIPTCRDKHGFLDACGPDGLEYPEPLPGLHGFGYHNSTACTDNSCDKYHDYSIVDNVVIPRGIPPGDYLVSWRWDCEQTHQIWQNCADVAIV